MVKVTMTADERAVSYAVLRAHGLTSYGAQSAKFIQSIRLKLDKGTSDVALTDKEANVLMDAIAEHDDDESGADLAERLTGRTR